MIKIILFNGPPRSGKDTLATLAEAYLQKHGKTLRYRMAEPLKNAVHALFGYKNVDTEYFDLTKGEPQERMFGLTPRKVYIWLSEECVKPLFGKDAFAKIAANVFAEGEKDGVQYFVVSDTGFQEELQVLSTRFGARNILVMRLKRQGCTFEGDSRNYVQHYPFPQVDFTNDGNMLASSKALYKIIDEFLDNETK